MGYGPVEEHYAERAQQGIHDVDHQCHLRGIRRELSEKITREHEERRPWRMTDLQLVGGSDELRTIPERSRGFDGGAVREGSNGKCQPSEHVVH